MIRGHKTECFGEKHLDMNHVVKVTFLDRLREDFAAHGQETTHVEPSVHLPVNVVCCIEITEAEGIGHEPVQPEFRTHSLEFDAHSL